MIYPYTGEETYLVNHFLNKGFSVLPVVLNGSGLSGKNYNFKKNKLDTNDVTCTNDLEYAINNSTHVYLCDNCIYYDKIIRLLQCLIGLNKDIMCSLELLEDDYNFYKDSILYLPLHGNLDVTDKNEIFDFYTPVIAITKIFNGLNEDDVLFELTHRLRKNNIKVSGVCDCSDAGLIGLHTFEECDFNCCCISKEKIFGLNHFVKKIETEENPDIIIIQYPEPIFKYDEDVCFDFGLSSYAISQAILPDYGICCTTPTKAYEQYWENFNDILSKKHGFYINSIVIDNAIIEANEMKMPGISPIFHIPGNTKILLLDDFYMSEGSIDDQYSKLIQELKDQLLNTGITFI